MTTKLIRKPWRYALLFGAVPACSPTLPPPTLAPAPAQMHDTEQSHLLLFPIADAESLLGRAVHVTGDGAWTIADSRAPGCEVAVRKEDAQFRASREVDMHSMTSLSAGYAKFVSIEASFGRSNTANIDIANTQILHADTRGACGETIVDSVFVGHGKRDIVASATAAASANVNVGVVSASPGFDTGSKVVDGLEWQNDQAYGFTYAQIAKSEPLEIQVHLPKLIKEGENVEVHFTSKQPAYLVVYYISGGKADVLWPSDQEPAPKVAPDAPAILPSANERANNWVIKAELSPGENPRQTLVVYGFANKADFDEMKPGVDGSSEDGPTYVAELTKKLDQVPLSRWSRAMVGFEIEPKPAAATPRSTATTH